MVSKEVKQVIQDSPHSLSLPFQQSFTEFADVSKEKIQTEPVFIIPEPKSTELKSWQEGYIELNSQLRLEGFALRDIPYKRPKYPPSQPVAYRKREGIQPELTNWQTLKDAIELTENFELSISTWKRKRSLNEKWKLYEKLRKKDKDIPHHWESMGTVNGNRVDHPLIGILMNKAGTFYEIVTKDFQTGPYIEKINKRNRPFRKEVKILAEEKIWHQLTLSDWEWGKGVIEYNAKIQGWEISISYLQ